MKAIRFKTVDGELILIPVDKICHIKNGFHERWPIDDDGPTREEGRFIFTNALADIYVFKISPDSKIEIVEIEGEISGLLEESATRRTP